MQFLKTTALGGLVFLVPLVIVAVIVGKALELTRGVFLFLESKLPMVTVSSFLVLNLLALFTLLVLCFAAGLCARSGPGRRLQAKLDASLAGIVPGYSFLKSLTQGLRANEENSEVFLPVLATFDDNSQIAFEVERSETGKVVLYLPGCPDPWSGSVIYMDAERVEPLGMTTNEALKNIRKLGRGSAAHASRLT